MVVLDEYFFFFFKSFAPLFSETFGNFHNCVLRSLCLVARVLWGGGRWRWLLKYSCTWARSWSPFLSVVQPGLKVYALEIVKLLHTVATGRPATILSFLMPWRSPFFLARPQTLSPVPYNLSNTPMWLTSTWYFLTEDLIFIICITCPLHDRQLRTLDPQELTFTHY